MLQTEISSGKQLIESFCQDSHLSCFAGKYFQDCQKPQSILGSHIHVTWRFEMSESTVRQ